MIDTIKPFQAKDQLGNNFNLSDLIGKKKILLYFYPKDDTPGCTLEAKDFSAKYSEFKKHNCEIIGISRDSVQSHKKFCDKYQLNITLLADVDESVFEEYNAFKVIFGNKGIRRSTFLFNEEGKLIKHWSKVTVDGHADEVLSVLASS